jgi:8-oxo-dGTP pyrophosphatase MutT (NUDIX family)
LKRSAKSKFMANLLVFPGGRLEPADHQKTFWREHGDLDRPQFSRRLAEPMALAEAAAYCLAAIRECLEEAGVFLAHTAGRSDGDLNQIIRQAQSTDRSDHWFVETVKREGWILELSALRRWSHWITPRQMARRFDTRFFIAAMPSGQSCRPDEHEAVDGIWIDPRQALEENLNGRVALSPPTLVTLHQLLNYAGLTDTLAAARHREWGRPIRPRLIPLKQGALILEPWDPAYNHNPIELAPDRLESAILEVGEPFSRLWYAEGLWRPVAAC